MISRQPFALEDRITHLTKMVDDIDSGQLTIKGTPPAETRRRLLAKIRELQERRVRLALKKAARTGGWS